MSQTERRTKARKESHSHDTQQVEEEIYQDGIHKAKSEEGFSEDTNGKGTDYHVGRQPLRVGSVGQAVLKCQTIAGTDKINATES